MRVGLTLIVLIALAGCGSETHLTPGDGRLAVPGGEIFYRVVGSGPGIPVVVLHGGPGYSAYYLEPLAALGKDRPVILYDQLGSGRSDHVTDTSLFTVDHYVQELDSLRRALKLDRIHLYGHSWGTMLALSYLATKPAGVVTVTLASPVITSASWAADGAALVATLPDSIQQTIARHEAAGTTSSEEYQAASQVYMQRYVFGLGPPFPAYLDSAVATYNPAVYETMWGPSEFRPTGTLRDFDQSATLAALTIPVLFTAGRSDEARPETVERFARTAKDAQVEIFENSAHLTMVTEPDAYVAKVGAFLRAHDR
ncbi:MAG: proline iminopeptidase-family hydrolase [Gemmatimonadales bacterium]